MSETARFEVYTADNHTGAPTGDVTVLRDKAAALALAKCWEQESETTSDERGTFTRVEDEDGYTYDFARTETGVIEL